MSFISGYCLLRNRTIISDTSFHIEALDLNDFQNMLYEALRLAYPKFYKMDPQSKLGFLATEILLKNVPLHAYPGEAVAVVLSNANASLDTDIRFQDSVKHKAASPGLFIYTLANIVTGEICIRHKFQGENAFFISPSFDAELLQTYVDQVLLQPETQACIAGWVDVLGEQHDVFLYLVERQKRGLALAHTATQLKELYSQ